MIRKTEAIVLNTRKFGDSSLICSMYTRAYGRQNYLVKGYRSTKARKRHSYFQPMSIIEAVFYFKESRDLQLITETHNRHFFQDLQTNPVKITLGMVIIEVFYLSVREEEQNVPLFEFLRETLVALDQQSKRLIHDFIHYLVHLTRFLGFFPDNQVRDPEAPVYFDMDNGRLENAPGVRTSDHLVAQFCGLDRERARHLNFSNAEKSELLSSLFQYYQTHVEGFRKPESLKVLMEVFS